MNELTTYFIGLAIGILWGFWFGFIHKEDDIEINMTHFRNETYYDINIDGTLYEEYNKEELDSILNVSL